MDLMQINIRNINLLEKLPDKLPIYNGFRHIEYIPVTFKYSAICSFLFLPDVPSIAYPVVIILITEPKKHNKKETKNIFSSYMCSFCIKNGNKTNKKRGRKLLFLKKKFPKEIKILSI